MSRFAIFEIHPSEMRNTKHPNLKFLDITRKIRNIVHNAQIAEGIIAIAVLHTTATIAMIEREAGLIVNDLADLVTRLVHDQKNCSHDRPHRLERLTKKLNRREPENGVSHLRVMLLNIASSIMVIIHEQKLLLGTWQRIIFIDGDPQNEATRTVAIQIIGE